MPKKIRAPTREERAGPVLVLLRILSARFGVTWKVGWLWSTYRAANSNTVLPATRAKEPHPAAWLTFNIGLVNIFQMILV